MVNEHLNDILSDMEKTVFDCKGKYKTCNEESLLKEFLCDKKDMVRYKRWSLIPVQQYYALLQRFMQQGEFARIPYGTVYYWIDEFVIPNLITIECMTEFFGRKKFFPSGAFRNVFGKIDENVKFDRFYCQERLSRIGFYKWCKFPDGTSSWSDFGLDPIWDILKSIPGNASASDLLIALNRILDVTHYRGDLSSVFIEGGKRALSSISESGYIP